MVASHLSGGVGAAGVALDGVRASALAVATTVNVEHVAASEIPEAVKSLWLTGVLSQE